MADKGMAHTDEFAASCPGTRLAGSFKRDLGMASTLTADTTTELNGKMTVQRTQLATVFLGACPGGLAPGAKKMRAGMVMTSVYHKREWRRETTVSG